MRIGINFHASDDYISGVEYYSIGLINALLQIDQANNYFVYTNRPALVEGFVVSHRNIKIVRLKHLRTRLARIVWEHTLLPQAAEHDRLDVLHCCSYICPLRKSTVPYIVTVHDTIAIDRPQWCKRSNAVYFNAFMEPALDRARRVVSPSKCTVADLTRNFNLQAHKLRMVYPGIDEIFNTAGSFERRAAVRARYHLPERYLLYAGNIEPKKNIWTLLCVSKKIRAKGLPHKLVIAGKRSWQSKVELDEIARQVAAGNIILTGYVQRNDLPVIYQIADVFVFLSLYEGFGFPPLEAMACGTAVVSSATGALQETVGDAALVVQPHNIEQIAEAVVSLIQDGCLRQEYVTRGLKHASQFDWKETARRMLALYEEAARCG